ncbi:hypothetical protein LguiB_021577 [Lonicera macranthoides]
MHSASSKSIFKNMVNVNVLWWVVLLDLSKPSFKRRTQTWLHFLKGVHGYIMPGTTTLLLGPPGEKVNFLTSNRTRVTRLDSK